MTGKKTYFASNLKYLRMKNKMEQLELANYLGRKSASSISEWEKGKYTPKSGLLSEIAGLFKVSLTDLMERDLSMENNLSHEYLSSQEIVYISEHLDPRLVDEWVNFGKDLMDKQENLKKTSNFLTL
ncbi:helix-turn-helix domain-containing protein [Streptococcus didelphis]|uniref:Helix-turn-helix domain-containing protein n=1 Tax=Streptococcus didelphis TaxID=102886 RepID=A0ABY9LG07_9STRE|nr:helix-turn-helix transcriptional regulator [Streptococcus didelphis]WMB27794.1 helix-turn-helix domain-containing protein [Streptococcus didelphis]